MGMETVTYSVHGRYATIEMNRPDVLNAMNEQMLRELLQALKLACESEADIVVLSGSGRGFSAGGDIKTMLNSMDNSGFSGVMDLISEVITTLYTLPKITVSAIHGPAAGLGFSLALAADYVVAHSSSVLAMNFIGIGLVPDGGGHYFMEKRLGEAKAKQLIWGGDKLSADEAYKLGLVDLVCDVDLKDAVQSLVSEWLQKPVKAMIASKNIYSAVKKSELVQILSLEKETQYNMRQSKDHQEGINAFLEKRKPQFTGK
jgi:enoyl-CoA hydratase/carnithine racemase